MSSRYQKAFTIPEGFPAILKSFTREVSDDRCIARLFNCVLGVDSPMVAGARGPECVPCEQVETPAKKRTNRKMKILSLLASLCPFGPLRKPPLTRCNTIVIWCIDDARAVSRRNILDTCLLAVAR